MAVDLGAARTRVYVRGAGLVIDEPSVAAVDVRTGSLMAVGAPADRMAGRTPEHIRVVRPVRGGMVVDIAMAQRMLRQMLGRRLGRGWRRLRPVLRAAVCTPHGSEPLARHAASQTLLGLGARRVELVDGLIAAAVGCGLPVEQPEACMVIASGASVTQVAVLSLGSVVAAETMAVGGDAVDRALVQLMRNDHELLLPSESLRPLHGVICEPGRDAAGVTPVHGRDVASGLARTVEVDTGTVRRAITSPMAPVIDAVGAVLRRCPPDLVADLSERGITLAGGAALMPGLDTMLRDATGMPVAVADEPDTCAVRGLGALIEGRVLPVPAFQPQPAA
jgi:rod shape-determining protein MreB